MGSYIFFALFIGLILLLLAPALKARAERRERSHSAPPPLLKVEDLRPPDRKDDTPLE
jgi:hypothetical protein